MSVFLAACGGGGGGGSTATTTSPTADAAAPSAPVPAPVSAPVVVSESPAASSPTACRKALEGVRRTVPGIGLGEPEADAHQVGMWSPVFEFPLIPVHAALTPDGRVMAFGTTREGRQTARFNYSVWDPTAGLGAEAHLSLPNVTNTDIFCSGQILMPLDGRMLIAGGDNYVNGAATNTGNADTTVFDPATNQLTQGGSMYRSRWYGTATTLGNGEILLMGGQANPALPVVNDRAEVRQADGSFRVLADVDTTRFGYWYPRGFPTRDGRVFGFETGGGAYHIDTAGTGRLSPTGSIGLHPIGQTSSVASFAPGRLLVAGGTTAAAVTIEFDGPAPIVRQTASLSGVREYVNLTVLPNGDVVATGGSAVENELSGVANHAEIWSPSTGQWTRGASGALARLYHSVALLLPDGSVMVGGGGAPGPLTNTNAELYFPPYLFDADGKWATRPKITSAPGALDPGAALSLAVEGPRPIARLTLVKTGAATHSLNFDQRFMELPFTASGGRLSATLPANVGDLSPGFWMVFAIDDRGVPSVASILRVMVPDVPRYDYGWTPSIGGQMRQPGTRFAATCEAGEVMVGVRGALASWGTASIVGQVQPLCARPDAAGRWTGSPVARGTPAGNATSVAFERTCPTNQAVVGLEARAGGAVDGFRLACASLVSGSTTDGPTTLLPLAGGAGGTENAPIACVDGRASTGLYGLAANSVATMGLVCGAPVTDPRTVPTTPPPPPAPVAPVAPPPTPPTGTAC
jgi:hypothetical protein